MSFLTSRARVKRPDEDNWGKLRRVLQYLKGTRKLKLCLKVTSLEEAHWFVDASHEVHWDCKGQTGASMTLGKEAIINSSLCQKINTKSSCETELVGVDDVILTVLWSYTLSKHRATKSRGRGSTKTTRAPSYSRRTDECPAARGRSTSRTKCSSYTTVWSTEK